MVDTVTAAVRSRMMRGIRATDTKPEKLIRSGLHAAGFRFRNNGRVEGVRPDLVLRRWNAAIFVHGCFWHRHEGCGLAYTPKSRVEFWNDKFAKNVERDARQYEKLRAAGWRQLVIWECGLRSAENSARTIEAAARWLQSRSIQGEIPQIRRG